MTRDDIIRMAEHAGFGMPVQVFQFRAEELERFARLVAAAEKELIARWVESWGNDLTVKEIAEGIRNNGNDAERPLKYVTREEPL